MSQPQWEPLRNLWAEDDGALIDVYVEGTVAEDWQAAVNAALAAWPSSYCEDGEPAQLPSAEEALTRSRARSCLLRVALTPLINLNTHFFAADEVEFDFDPREVLDQDDLDQVCGFMRTVGRAIGKPVWLGIEGGPPRPPANLRYDPADDSFSYPGDDDPSRHGRSV